MFIKVVFSVLAVLAIAIQAKPSHPFGLHAIHEHFDWPAPHFEVPAPAPPLWPAPAVPIPAPAPIYHLPAPAPFVPAAPVIHAPFFAAAAPVPAPLPVPVPAPVPVPVPVAAPIPTYRAIPGPRTTTHHVSVGYALPQPVFGKVIAHHAPHTHLHHWAFGKHGIF